MRLAGWVRTSTVDFPGKLATVLFTVGCDIDCFFCHNRHLLDPRGPAALEESVVLEHLDRRRGLLDGVVITGGEPALQPDLASFIRKIRDRGYLVKLDTNGAHPGVLCALLEADGGPLLDGVAMDYKAPWDRYPDVCGCAASKADAVQESLRLLLENRCPDWELRTTVIPQLTADDLVGMAASVPPVPRFALQQYKPPERYRPEDRFRVTAAALGASELRQAAERIRPVQPGVIVRA